MSILFGRIDSARAIVTESGSSDESMDVAGVEPFKIIEIRNEKGFLYTEIELTSPILVALLKGACINYPGVEYKVLFANKVVLRQPFMMLFYNLDKIQELASESKGVEKQVLDRLQSFLKTQNTHTAYHRLELRVSRTILFRDIWLLYRPGTTVYQRPLEDGESWRAFKISCVTHREYLNDMDSEIQITFHSLAFDKSGKRLIQIPHIITLTPYTGECFINDLELIPASVLPGHQLHSLRASLEKRGRKYWSFSGKAVHQRYQGIDWCKSPKPEMLRVVIDYTTGSRYIPPYPSERTVGCDAAANMCSCCSCVRKYAALSSYPTNTSKGSRACPRDPYPMIEPPFAQDDEDRHPPNPFLYCPSHVDAFSVQYKSWRSVEISALADVEKSSELLDRLVLAQRSKSLLDIRVDALVNPSVPSATSGLTVLLRGTSGTGKTLTAVAVAEAYGRPLYTLHWPDLVGMDSAGFGQHVTEALFDAENWGAMIVVDYVDMLLSSSDNKDVKLDTYTSIFMEKLERFQGVAFLIARRADVQVLDLIRSRIHLVIQFPTLTTDARARIWSEMVRAAPISPQNTSALLAVTATICGYNLNGHQLQNCLSAVLIMAKRDGAVLKRHIDLALSHDTEFLATGTPSQHREMHRRLSSSTHLRFLENSSDNTPIASPKSPTTAPKPILKPNSPASPLRSTETIRNLRFDLQSTAFPFPLINSPGASATSHATRYALPSPKQGLSITSLSTAGGDPASSRQLRPLQRPLAGSRMLSTRGSERPNLPLRRHTTQSSLDPPATPAKSQAAVEGWTWKMLPARVRRPQLRFEKGLPDTDDEGIQEGVIEEEEGDEEVGEDEDGKKKEKRVREQTGKMRRLNRA